MDCIVCHRHLPDIDTGVRPKDNHPSGGSEFHTYGHYGSEVTDGLDGIAHCINVCDGCLKIALALGRAFRCDVNRQRVSTPKQA
jgi:hypothetical protein